MADFPKKTLADWEKARRQGAARQAAVVARLDDARGHRREAALHRGRSRRPRDPGRAAGLPAVHARAQGHDVCRPALDGAPVRRLLDRRGEQQVLSRQSRGRPDGPVGGVRSRHPPRLRFRSSARGRRRRQGGRGDRLRRGHEDPVRRHPARQDERVDDHERRRAAGAGGLHRGGRGAGRAAGQARRARSRTTSSRSSWSGTPTSIRPDPSMRIVADIIEYTAHAHAEVQLDLDLRLSHAGGGRDAGSGAGLHAGRRARIRARRQGQGPRHRRLRAAPVLLLLHRHELLHGGGQAARRALPVGRADQAVRAQEGRFAVAAHALPDLGRVAHRAGPLQQRHPHRLRGDGGGAGRHAVAAHQFASTRRSRCRRRPPRASRATRSSSCSTRPASPRSSIRWPAATTSRR